MTQQNQISTLIFSSLMAKRTFLGATIGLVLLFIFFIIVGAFADGSWETVPMLTVAVGGALGGAFYHIAEELAVRNHWNKVVVTAICLIVYLAGLWLGFVNGLSLVGLWD